MSNFISWGGEILYILIGKDGRLKTNTCFGLWRFDMRICCYLRFCFSAEKAINLSEISFWLWEKLSQWHWCGSGSSGTRSSFTVLLSIVLQNILHQRDRAHRLRMDFSLLHVIGPAAAAGFWGLLRPDDWPGPAGHYWWWMGKGLSDVIVWPACTC